MEPQLSFIRSEIDQDRNKPLDRKSIIPLFNEYILRLCDIQNSFASRLEASFATLENRLERAETLLCLVEKRLERVNLSISDGVPPTVIETQITNAEVEATIPEVPEIRPETTIEEPTVVEEDKNMMKIRDHPVYKKYFTMLRLGIPEPAVIIKMSSEGIDPTLLSNPEKLIEAVTIEDPESGSDSDD